MEYDLQIVINQLEESAKAALKDGGTSDWGHRTLQIVEWLKDYRRLKELDKAIADTKEDTKEVERHD